MSVWLQVILAATSAAIVALLAQRWIAGREPKRTQPAAAEEPDEQPARKYAGELGLFR